MNLIPWRAIGYPLARRSDLQPWFGEFFDDGLEASNLPRAFRAGLLPRVNVSENDKEFFATIELPGLEDKDIDVQLLGKMLVVSGERKWEKDKKGKHFYRVESEYGAFRREIELPEGLVMDPDSIRASFSRGILEITLPKAQPTTASKIKVVPSK